MKKILSIVLAAAMSFAMAGVLTSCGETGIDLNQYMSIEVDGYDTMGTAKIYFDSTSFLSDYSQKISYKDGTEAYQTALGADAAQALLQYIEYPAYVSPYENLSNGDEVTLSWMLEEDQIEEIFNVKLKFSDFTDTVEDLQDIELIDPFDGVSLEYSGISSRASASVVSTNGLLNSENYILDISDGISEGDMITVSISDETAQKLLEQGKKATQTSRTYQATGLDRSEAEILLQNAGENIIDSGYCGGDVAWTLDEDGLLTLAGSGSMEDYLQNIRKAESVDSDTVNNAPWGSYLELIRRVEIGDGITSIGNGAFLSCESLTDVTLPDSLTSIGSNAFRYSSVSSIIMPDSVTSIGEYSFDNCQNLQELRLSSNLERIPDAAFFACSALTSVVVPGSVTEICNQAFACCYSLESVELNDGTETLGFECFRMIPVHSITIPSTVTSLGMNLFWSYSDLPWYSDYNNTMTYVLDVTFRGDCPDSLYWPFYNARVNIYYPSNNETWTSQIDSLDIKADEANLIPYEAEPSGSCGEGVTWTLSGDGTLTISGSGTVSDYAEDASAPWISYTGEITSIVVDSGVTGIGKGAFRDCTLAGTITFNGDAPSFGAGCFQNLTLTAYYPGDNATWTADVMQDRGGTVAWEAY